MRMYAGAGALLLLISTLRIEVIGDALESLAAFLFVCAVEFRIPTEYWSPALADYWLAATTWIAVGGFLAVRIGSLARSRTVVPPNLRWSSVVAAGVVFLSLTAPILAPFDPSFQGMPTTTRLLPPLSGGSLKIEPTNASEPDRGAIGWLARAGDRLLRQRMELTGELLPATHASRVLFLLGTDDNGRDVLSRVIHGSRVSLAIGMLAAFGSVLIGACIGFVAGYSMPLVDSALMRVTDLALAVPAIFVVLLVVALFGPTFTTIVIALALTGWMTPARIIRLNTISLRQREFVLAARMLGVPPHTIIRRHMIPNLRPVLVTALVLQFANAVLAEAALGFLGLGIQPPTPTWGNMMSEATGYLQSAWWVGVFPGIALSAVLIATHDIGEHRTPPSAEA